MRPSDIRKLCEKYGTQKEVAQRVGIGHVHLNKVINGVSPLSEKMIARIKKSFPEDF